MSVQFRPCFQRERHIYTAQKIKFSIKDFFSKCDQICRKLRIWSHLLKKSFMDIFIFCTVLEQCLTNPFATLLKNTPTQLFSCEFCEIFKNTYFEEHLRTTASFILVSLLWTLNKFHKLTLSSPIFHFML